jgi:NADH-quinone oxidoreductase subunit J
MNVIASIYFWVCALTALGGALGVVVAKNPIRGAMGLLLLILSVAGLFLALHAQFLAAIQLIVYAGAIVILFLFVIMLLGPSATSGRDTRTWSARYLAAAVFLASSVTAMALLRRIAGTNTTPFGSAPRSLGTIEGIGHELFTTALLPFELSSALLLVAVVGAIAVARGRQVDPTMQTAGSPGAKPFAGAEPAPAHEKEHAS